MNEQRYPIYTSGICTSGWDNHFTSFDAARVDLWHTSSTITTREEIQKKVASIDPNATIKNSSTERKPMLPTNVVICDPSEDLRRRFPDKALLFTGTMLTPGREAVLVQVMPYINLSEYNDWRVCQSQRTETGEVLYEALQPYDLMIFTSGYTQIT